MILSILYCHFCDKYIDIDFQAEHFNETLTTCIKQTEDETK